MSKDRIFVTELYSTVEKSLAVKEKQKKIEEGVGKYIDVNLGSFSTPGPSTRPIFSEMDKAILYDNIGVGRDQIRAVIKSNPAIKAQWNIMNEAVNVAIALTLRYAGLNKIDNLEKALIAFTVISMYPSLHYKYFRLSNPNPRIMDYTLANMSNKYKVKQSGNIYRAMYETVEKCYETKKEVLLKGDDKGLVSYIMDAKTRLNSLLKNISRAYYDNHKKNLYLNLDSDNYDEDNYHEADSNVFATDRITNNVVLKLIVNGPDMQTVTLAAKMAEVSVNEMRNYTNKLIDSDRRAEIRELIEAIITTYVVDEQKSPEEISRNNHFLLHANNLYKKSNTNDEKIIKIKKILDKWMVEDLDVYKKTQRQATINNFRRGLYLFFVISIMKLS